LADLPSADRDRAQTQERRQCASDRLQAAADRDAAAHARDAAADARDQIAALRDQEMAGRDPARADERQPLTGVDVVMRAAEDRRSAAADRALAAEARALAADARREAADARREAALDREQAARDRLEALADRDALVRQLAAAETDALTGARTRAAGLLDLEHEIDRARRTGESLVVAYLDVVGLKRVNDTRGHAAGDELLKRVVEELRKHLRSYDVLVRVGGDEFLCAMLGATRQEALLRFRAVRSALAATRDRIEIKVGFAVLARQDSADALMQRADAELPTSPDAAG
jgi:diguanylate cyclase (GGDEF)-like protein